MPLSVLQAMRDSKTADDFLLRLGDAIGDNNLKGVKRTPAKKYVEELAKSEPKYPSVVFFDPADEKAERIFLSFDRLEYAGRIQHPRLRVHSVNMYLSNEGWLAAKTALGKAKYRHGSGKDSSKSITLRIPLAAVAHWAPSTGLKGKQGAYESIQVPASGNLLRRLASYSYVQYDVVSYLNSLNQFSPERIGKPHFVARLKLGPPEKPIGENFNEVQYLLDQKPALEKLYARFGEIASRGPTRFKAEEFSAAISAHFAMKESPFTLELGKKLFRYLQNDEHRACAERLHREVMERAEPRRIERPR
ncbi:hypothetical protein COY71_03085 [Candidatus Micrarchaeota archaeon CG_4_10_14_0_8_um_filter_60_7]|nr:MAG: hypothetical protein COT58_03060 [Candidatus Micrarchaeota archaeon CG09_land_8_20_14_0_10_60_16]PIY91441.1 MAG: hypothetical protein COY71_03085 [Candidatus Micrarchaeota archaeon CG_4_10_14_0_8_um_filter_60_7]